MLMRVAMVLAALAVFTAEFVLLHGHLSELDPHLLARGH